MGDRLSTTNMGWKVGGGCCDLWEGSWVPI